MLGGIGSFFALSALITAATLGTLLIPDGPIDVMLTGKQPARLGDSR